MVHSMALRPEAIEHGLRAIAIGESTGDLALLADALLNSGLTSMLQGHWATADEMYARGAAAQRAVGSVMGAEMADVNRAFLQVRRGDVDAADVLGARAVRSLERFGNTSALGYAHVLRAEVAIAVGELDRAAHFNAVARSVFAEAGERGMTADCDVQAMEIFVATDRADDALALSAAMQRDLGAAEPTTVVTHDLFVAVAHVLTGDPVLGAAGLVAAADAARRAGMPYETYRCVAALMELASVGGPPAPEGAAQECEQLQEKLGLVPGRPLLRTP
jgi:hypothetical protein